MLFRVDFFVLSAVVDVVVMIVPPSRLCCSRRVEDTRYRTVGEELCMVLRNHAMPYGCQKSTEDVFRIAVVSTTYCTSKARCRVRIPLESSHARAVAVSSTNAGSRRRNGYPACRNLRREEHGATYVQYLVYGSTHRTSIERERVSVRLGAILYAQEKSDHKSYVHCPYRTII